MKLIAATVLALAFASGIALAFQVDGPSVVDYCVSTTSEIVAQYPDLGDAKTIRANCETRFAEGQFRTMNDVDRIAGDVYRQMGRNV